MAVMGSLTPAVKYKPALNKRQTEAAKFNRRNARDSKGRTKSKAYRQDVRVKAGRYKDEKWRGYGATNYVYRGATAEEEIARLQDKLKELMKVVERSFGSERVARHEYDRGMPSDDIGRALGARSKALEEIKKIKQALPELERNKANINRAKKNKRPEALQKEMNEERRLLAKADPENLDYYPRDDARENSWWWRNRDRQLNLTTEEKKRILTEEEKKRVKKLRKDPSAKAATNWRKRSGRA